MFIFEEEYGDFIDCYTSFAYFLKVEGLLDALKSDPMVCSNYWRQSVEKTFPALQAFNGGSAIFTFPNTPLKCPGAAQFMYLADDHWRTVSLFFQIYCNMK